MDYEEDHLELGRELRNITKNMDSFDPKPAQAELSATPMDTTTIWMSPCPRLDERMTEMMDGNLIDTQELRRVEDNNHTENAYVMADGSGDMYLRYRQPRLTKIACGCLMIKVEEVVNKTITDLHISYDEPDISTITSTKVLHSCAY